MNALEALYGVKVILTYSVNGERYFYEEQIIAVKASSFDEAYEKAEQYVERYREEHLNPKGETVKVERIEAVDCFHAFEAEEDDVLEIYSSYVKNKTSLPEEEYYQTITDQCTAEELYDLRYSEFNVGHQS